MVLAGAYTSGDGGMAVPVASIANEDVAFTLSLDAAQYPIPATGSIRLITEDDESIVGGYEGGKVHLPVELPPRRAQIYEFR